MMVANSEKRQLSVEQRKPYLQGYKDRLARKKFKQCPYERNSWQAKKWQTGWKHADKDTKVVFEGYNPKNEAINTRKHKNKENDK